jgi:hypothetical protein
MSVEVQNSANIVHEMAHIVNTVLQNGDIVCLFTMAGITVEYRQKDVRNVCGQPCLSIVFNVFSFL